MSVFNALHRRQSDENLHPPNWLEKYEGCANSKYRKWEGPPIPSLQLGKPKAVPEWEG